LHTAFPTPSTSAVDPAIPTALYSFGRCFHSLLCCSSVYVAARGGARAVVSGKAIVLVWCEQIGQTARLSPMSSETATKASTLSEQSLSDSESVKFELVTAKQWEREWTARDTASVRLQLLGRVLCCRNKPRIRWIHSKGAILVLLWNSLVLNHYGNLGFILAGALELNSVHTAGVIYLLLTLVFDTSVYPRALGVSPETRLRSGHLGV